MSGFKVIIGLCFLLCLLLDGVNGQKEEKREVYVVYMGAVPSQTSENTLKENYIELLASVLPRDKPIKKSLIRQYKHGFSGFVARLTKNEANALQKKAGVISVFVDPIYELHTTRSWDFLEETSESTESTHAGSSPTSAAASDTIIDLLDIVSPESIQTRLMKNEANAIKKKVGVISAFVDPIYELHITRPWDFLEETSLDTESTESTHAGSSPTSAAPSDTIIGLFDSGIWPESESFRDSGMGPIPSRWKGICMKGDDFNSSNCNRKLIGARYYDLDDDDDDDDESYSPRDELGHGTHTSSTAAGNPVMEASMYGLAKGTAKGGSISSRIAMYKVCGLDGCPGSAMLSAFDDAIADGVDLLSISIGANLFFRPDFLTDPIAIGAFHAVERGITVVCSAGNDGPQAESVVNAAPWILTVGATTIDRHFESDVLLGGNNKAVKGSAINFSNLNKSASYPLIYGASAKSNTSDDAEASHCNIDSIDGTKIKGKIVLCKSSDSDISKIARTTDLKIIGAVGAIVVDDRGKSVESSYIDFPVTEVTTEGSDEILKYINSTKNPMATILPTITVPKYKPAPQVAYFSSRGPSSQTSNIIKPDISAPGVNILASWTQNEDSNVVLPGQKPSHFNLDSGTSMACPHVAGIVATIKSWNPTWSPAAIRSAIMTTAKLTNNDKVPVTTDSGSAATPYDYGAGVINPTKVLQPGLVYEIETNDYLQFLCNYGYTRDIIKNMTVIPNGFECSKNSSKNLISNLNYPSIAISDFTAKERRLVSRVVKNVGGAEVTTYVVSIKSPPELNVEVSPDKLQFSKSVTKLSYQISFSASSSQLKGDYFGSITWSDGAHRVRSPFVVKSS